jgi:uncharacterized protein (TIGR02147 family)
MTDIFTYLDYRKYLKDYYDEKKAENPHFSYRYIAGKVGFKSAGLFTKILQGKRNISMKLTLRFIEAFKLRKKEADYFELLVQFNQARTASEKNHFFEKLLGIKKSKIAIVDADKYEFYDKWYYTAIREILSFYRFNDDYRELSRMVMPSISPSEAKRAIELLMNLGFVSKRENGTYERIEPVISTGYDARSIAIHKLVLGTMDLARESIDRFPKEQRNLSSLTLSISLDSFQQIQEELRGFRRRLMEIANHDENPDRVYQINFQVFPVSRIAEGKSV